MHSHLRCRLPSPLVLASSKAHYSVMIAESHTLDSLIKGGRRQSAYEGFRASAVTADSVGDSSSMAMGFLPAPLMEVYLFPPCKHRWALACSICCPVGMKKETSSCPASPKAQRPFQSTSGRSSRSSLQPASPLPQALLTFSFPLKSRNILAV